MSEEKRSYGPQQDEEEQDEPQPAQADHGRVLVSAIAADVWL